jgi:fibronectin type 3 domain-containing protein
MKLIGNEPGVKVDKVVFTSDLNCVPTGFGDNCNAPSDTTAPSTQLTAPASGATVSGSVNLAATVTDASGVSKAEFYVNGILLASDTSSPYGASWDSTKAANGSHSLSVRGYDVAGNMSTSSITVTVKNGDTQAPTTPTGLSANALDAKTVRLKWSASSDSVGVTGYTLYRDGAPLATVNSSTLQYDDKSVVPNTTYKYKIDASDQAGNRSVQSASVSVTTPTSTVADTKGPSQPKALTAVAANASQVNLSWTKSEDNTGIAGYDVYRGVKDSFQMIGTTLVNTFGDTSVVAGTQYTYYVIARDFSGNSSPKSETAVVMTSAAPTQTHRIHGIIRQAGDKPLPGAKLSHTLGGVAHISQANRSGFYAVQNLKDGDYVLTAYKHGYESNDVTIKLKGADAEQAITLKKGK